MDSRQLWTLSFFYLSAVLCRPTNGVTSQMPSSYPYLGDSVTVRCVGSDRERVNLHKNDTEVQRDSTHQITHFNTVELRISPVSAEDQGLYSCVRNGNISLNQKPLYVTGRRRSISLTTSSTFISDQGSVTLTCSVEGYPNPQWLRRSSDSETHLEILIVKTKMISMSRGGVYSCRGSDEFIVTEESNKVTIMEIGGSPSVTLTTENHFIPNQGTVKLKCEVQGVSEYEWIRRSSAQNSTLEILKEDTPTVTVSRGGVYSCRGKLRFYTLTAESDRVTIWETVSNRAVVQPDPAWTEVFSGESLSLRCEVEDEGGSEWSYDWRKSGVTSPTTTREYTLSNVSVSDSGNYSCRATRETYQITMWSQETRLQVLNSVILLIPTRPVPEGRSVSLTCKLGQSAQFSSVRFYKDGQLIEEGSSRTYSLSALSKSDEGLYKCGIHLTSNQVLTSPESWLSVRSSEQSSSSVLVLVSVGAVFLIVLLILLLLLWRYKNNKDSCFVRSQETVPPEETYTELQRRDQEDIYHTIQEQEHDYDNIQEQQMVM